MAPCRGVLVTTTAYGPGRDRRSPMATEQVSGVAVDRRRRRRSWRRGRDGGRAAPGERGCGEHQQWQPGRSCANIETTPVAWTLPRITRASALGGYQRRARMERRLSRQRPPCRNAGTVRLAGMAAAHRLADADDRDAPGHKDDRQGRVGEHRGQRAAAVGLAREVRARGLQLRGSRCAHRRGDGRQAVGGIGGERHRGCGHHVTALDEHDALPRRTGGDGAVDDVPPCALGAQRADDEAATLPREDACHVGAVERGRRGDA